jgi:hypothetical protein
MAHDPLRANGKLSHSFSSAVDHGQRTLNCLGFQAEPDVLTAPDTDYGWSDWSQIVSFQTVRYALALPL